MNKKEEVVWAGIMLILLFSTAIIMFTAQAYEHIAYEPPERDWHSPYEGN